MFGFRKRGGPDRAFSHAPDCSKLVKIDPGIEIKWSEMETGHWVAECQCGKEHIHATPDADRRTRLDPLDPSTFRHTGQCEHRDTTDPALLRAILRVKDGMDGGYWWVECSACDRGWPVPHYGCGERGVTTNALPRRRHRSDRRDGCRHSPLRGRPNRREIEHHAMLVRCVYG